MDGENRPRGKGSPDPTRLRHSLKAGALSCCTCTCALRPALVRAPPGRRPFPSPSPLPSPEPARAALRLVARPPAAAGTLLQARVP